MPNIKFTDYLRRFKDWALAYQTSGELIFNPEASLFQSAVDKLVEVMESKQAIFPVEADANEYCKLLREAVQELNPRDKSLVGMLEIPICKSNCLARLWYGNQELRGEPCPKHKGRWGWSWEVECPCQDGCNITGWLPNESLDHL